MTPFGDSIVREGTSWEGVTARPGWFGVMEFRLGRHLLGALPLAGLVDERRNGTQRLYRARPQGLADLKAFLDAFWSERLEALQHDAEREEREERQDGKRD